MRLMQHSCRYGRRSKALLAGLCFSFSLTARAANIGVSPLLIDLSNGETVSGVHVRNGDTTQAISVQARVMRWHQDDTGDVYTPATDVVASPPVARIQPGAENLIRIVRTAKQPVQGEESYRLLIDELPEPGQASTNAVRVLIRHAVPVFIAHTHVTPARALWQIAHATQGNQHGYRITVQNTGTRRLRLVNLTLHDAQDMLVAQKPGLVTYVLGQSRVTVFIPAVNTNASPVAQAVRLSVRSEAGTIETALLPVASP